MARRNHGPILPQMYDQQGNREHGWYQQMKLSEFLKASGFLTAKMVNWAAALLAAGLSCGKMYYIGGSGAGSMTMEHQIGGPFQS